MPNHVQNALKLLGDKSDIEKVFESIKGEETTIDFNKILKMPESLNIESSSTGELGYFALTGRITNKLFSHEEMTRNYSNLQKEQKEEADELGKIYKSNFEKHGFTTWYDWRWKKWGTKWDAYETPDERDTEDTIYFQTAWNGVPEIIKLLNVKFPSVEFLYIWASEDTGYNVGIRKTKNGNMDANDPVPGSNEAYELALKLWPDYKDLYRLIGGKYEYVDEIMENELKEKTKRLE